MGCCAPFAGELGPRLTQCGWAKVYFVPSGVFIHPCSRLATIDMEQKLGGGCALFYQGSCVTIEHKVAWAEAYTSIPSGILVHPVVWPQRTLAENWGVCPLRGGRNGSPSNTMSPRPRPTSVPSGTLIQPFGHNR